MSNDNKVTDTFIKSLKEGPEKFDLTDEGHIKSYLGVRVGVGVRDRTNALLVVMSDEVGVGRRKWTKVDREKKVPDTFLARVGQNMGVHSKSLFPASLLLFLISYFLLSFLQDPAGSCRIRCGSSGSCLIQNNKGSIRAHTPTVNTVPNY